MWDHLFKAISTLKKKEEKEAEKASIKSKLNGINAEFIKGSTIAPLYRLDKVRNALDLRVDQVHSIYVLANTRSATSVQNEIKKLRKQKEDIDKSIKELENQLLGK